MSYFTAVTQKVFRGPVLIGFNKIPQLNTFRNLAIKPQLWADVFKFPEINSEILAKASEGGIYMLSLKRDRKVLPHSPAGARALTMPTHHPSSLRSLPGSGLQKAWDSP